MTYVAQMQSMGVIQPQKVQERYGISAESFNDIQQHINQHKQQAKDVAQGQVTLEQSEILTKLKEALKHQATQFERYRQITEQKFTTLSKELLDVTMQCKQLQHAVTQIKDKEDITAAREALHRYQQGDKPPGGEPIDRNGIAPKDVQLESIFNFSARK
ncbi:hypothetical protein GF367_00710 [Candidatus Woesearchaeota archaeon]|nr:hypothetical protein [Candidatus Woesearchaeota archaeon]